MRIGIFGGSFDPIHKVHLEIAFAAKEQFQMDRVYLIPANICPGKKTDTFVNALQRLKMCSIASKDVPWLISSDIEIKRSGISYTVDTVSEIKHIHPDDELFLILGSDKIKGIDKWYRSKELLSMVSVLAVDRECEQLRYENTLQFKRIKMVLSDISSENIRRKLENGEPVTGLLPVEVEEYVYENGFYFTDPIKRMQLQLKKDISDKRYVHTCAVMMRAAYLAKLYGVDFRKAQLAALLHDCAKNLPRPVLKVLSGTDTDVEAVLHAPAGAVRACIEYNVKDQEILRAIRLHTTGDVCMSKLDMLIYLADATEHTRNYPSVENIRKVSENRLEYGMKIALEYSLNYMKCNKIVIEPATLKAYEYYKNEGE